MFKMNKAVMMGNVQLIQSLFNELKLNGNELFEFRKQKGRLLLHDSAKYGHLSVLKWLLDKGFAEFQNFEYGNKRDYTAFHYAVIHDQCHVWKWILTENLIEITHKDRNGDNIINFSIKTNHLDVLQYLNERDLFNIKHIDSLGNTALDIAIRNKKIPIVQWLFIEGWEKLNSITDTSNFDWMWKYLETMLMNIHENQKLLFIKSILTRLNPDQSILFFTLVPQPLYIQSILVREQLLSDIFWQKTHVIKINEIYDLNLPICITNIIYEYDVPSPLVLWQITDENS